jgi:hypothetical protein
MESFSDNSRDIKITFILSVIREVVIVSLPAEQTSAQSFGARKERGFLNFRIQPASK